MNAHAANSMSRNKKCQSGGKLGTLDKLSPKGGVNLIK
jgi:hypothetical protein